MPGRSDQATPGVAGANSGSAVRGIAAGVIAFLLVASLGALVSAPHMAALQQHVKGVGDSTGTHQLGDPGQTFGAVLTLVYAFWTLLATCWIALIAGQGGKRSRIVLPLLIEALLVTALALLLP